MNPSISTTEQTVLPEPETILVLAGGGTRGFAHIGVWKALQEHGIRPDAIVGTSIGALMGALMASGLSGSEMEEIAVHVKKEDIIRLNRRIFWLAGVKQPSLLVGDVYQEFIRNLLPYSSFDDLQIPLRMNAVSLISGQEVWFGNGANRDLELADAIYASGAIPMYFPPLKHGEDYLADGAVRNALGIYEAIRWGGKRLIVSDIRGVLTSPEADWMKNGLIAVHERVMSVVNEERQTYRNMEWADVPMLQIRPAVTHFGIFEFEKTQDLIDRGYSATMDMLARSSGEIPSVEAPRLLRIFSAVGETVKKITGTVMGERPETGNGPTEAQQPI